jgi:HEAT repeat protein
VYAAVVRYIGEAGLVQAEPILIEELESGKGSEDYKEDIVRALGKLQKKSSLEHLVQYYYNKKSTRRIKRAIIDAWGEIGDIGIEDTLIRIVTDIREDDELKGRAILALGKVQSVKSLDILEQTATNTYENKYLRMFAVHSLGLIGGESVLEILGELLGDKDHAVAEYAVQSISGIATEKCGDYLIQALRSNFDKVRYYAVIGLADLKYKGAIEILTFKSEHDSNELVRKEAKKALEVIGTFESGGI